MPLNIEQLEDDIYRRRNVQRDEHPLISRLVVMRVHMNEAFGAAFAEFDHELAQVEQLLAEALPKRKG